MPNKPPTPEPSRTRKTPQDRATHALGVADRRVVALTKQRVEHQKKVHEIELELVDAERRRDYLAQSPDLPQPPQADETQESTT
jgi:hypothetical protein